MMIMVIRGQTDHGNSDNDDVDRVEDDGRNNDSDSDD